VFEVAARAGVSKSTVSRVLNGSPQISDRSRLAVLDAAREVGYRTNAAARTLRTSRSAVVGLVVPAINHQVFAEIAQRLDESLLQHGISLTVTSTAWRPEEDVRAIGVLLGRGVDAIVVAAANDRSTALRRLVRELDRPLVLLDRELRGARTDAVLTDLRRGTCEALTHLAQLGHERVALLRPPLAIRPGREAATAFHASAPELGLSVEGLELESRPGEEAAAVDAARSLGATALIVSGATAPLAGVLARTRELGLRIPEDLSLIAFDETELALHGPVALTTITRSTADIGRLAAEVVTARLAGDSSPALTRTVDAHLVVRDSTRPPRRRKDGR